MIKKTKTCSKCHKTISPLDTYLQKKYEGLGEIRYFCSVSCLLKWLEVEIIDPKMETPNVPTP